MKDNEIKDTVEFIAVNATGIGISFGDINATLRTAILLATLVYGIFKIIKIYKEIKKNR
tara:strand:+ start:4382 stop:4558 length:177 start_codon:yes stop_codon:yes gene_type:complete